MGRDDHLVTIPPRPRPYTLIAILIGSFLAVGGVAGGLMAMVSADRQAEVALHTLPCPENASCIVLGFSAPDYSGLWMGVVVAVLGVVVVAAAVLARYLRRHVA